MISERALVLVVLCGAALACRREAPTALQDDAGSPAPGAARPTCAAAEAEAARLDASALAQASKKGCSRVDECRSLPLGAKPCGGPEAYVVYCSKTTNEAGLRAALDAYERARRAANEACGLASDCAAVPTPQLALTDGLCEAQLSGGLL